MSVSSRRSADTGSPREIALRFPATVDGFSDLLEEMRLRAGLSVSQIATAWRVKPNALYQYFHKKRGGSGTGTLRWFLRYATTCGCEVTLRFPGTSRGEEKVVLTHDETVDQSGSDRTRVNDSFRGTHRGSGAVFLGRGTTGGDTHLLRGSVADATGSTERPRTAERGDAVAPVGGRSAT
jgi:hypothetical protein